MEEKQQQHTNEREKEREIELQRKCTICQGVVVDLTFGPDVVILLHLIGNCKRNENTVYNECCQIMIQILVAAAVFVVNRYLRMHLYSFDSLQRTYANGIF